MRHEVVRIELGPRLQCFAGLVEFARYVVVILFGYVKAFTLAYTIAKIIGLLNVWLGRLHLLLVEVMHADTRVGHREVWIEVDRPLVEGERFARSRSEEH